jgi:Xaa-Pro aminopeptidase
MPETQASRREALRALISDAGLDAALVTDLVNVRYLTGFTGSNAAVLLPATGADLFATDGRYVDQAAAQVPDLERITDRSLLPRLVAAARQRALRRLGVETHVLNVDQHARMLEDAGGELELLPLNRAVESLRVRKDAVEVEALRMACEISTRALEELLAGPLLGRSERDLARDLEARMYAHGAEAVGFDTIVASGPNSAIPHHQPTDRLVGPAELLKIDFGARYDGYHADCTRTVVIGTPQQWQLEIYGVVASAQRAGTEALAPGTELADVDAAARSVVESAGYGGQFTHGLGHGVGLLIHEDPFFGSRSTGVLQESSTVTVEPGVYLAGRGGVRIEDTLVVDAQGPRLLTTVTKELLALG